MHFVWIRFRLDFPRRSNCLKAWIKVAYILGFVIILIFIIIWRGKLTSCGGIFWIFLRLFLLFFEMSFEIIFSIFYKVLVYKCDIRKRKHLQTKQHPMWRWRLNSLEFFKLIIFHCIIEKKFVKTGYFKLLLFYITHQTHSLCLKNKK